MMRFIAVLAVAAWTMPGSLVAADDPAPAPRASPVPVGMFEGSGDVGTVLHPGSVTFDDATKSYTVAGSGENMWAARDAFQFAWKKLSGDFSLTADITFTGNIVQSTGCE